MGLPDSADCLVSAGESSQRYAARMVYLTEEDEGALFGSTTLEPMGRTLKPPVLFMSRRQARADSALCAVRISKRRGLDSELPSCDFVARFSQSCNFTLLRDSSRVGQRSRCKLIQFALKTTYVATGLTPFLCRKRCVLLLALVCPFPSGVFSESRSRLLLLISYVGLVDSPDVLVLCRGPCGYVGSTCRLHVAHHFVPATDELPPVWHNAGYTSQTFPPGGHVHLAADEATSVLPMPLACVAMYCCIFCDTNSIGPRRATVLTPSAAYEHKQRRSLW